jgi:8-oxo-dGTP pyrophosphatase MutT (NUDIX family)
MTLRDDIFNAREVRARALRVLPQDDPAGVFARTQGHLPGDFELNPGISTKPGTSLKPAAVLVPIIAKPSHASVLLTQRSKDLPSHAGQVSFPGGKIDAGDKTLLDTALRETEEEVGLARDFVEVLGFLDPYETGTGYRILPVVGLVKPGFTLKAEPGEVDDIFEVPLAHLMSPDNHQVHAQTFSGVERRFHAMSYQDRFIWGATAGILKNLYNRLYKV